MKSLKPILVTPVVDVFKGIGKRGQSTFGIVAIVVAVVVVVSLIPVIADTIAGATNLTATETTLLGLVTLFVVLGLVVGVAKKSGLLTRG